MPQAGIYEVQDEASAITQKLFRVSTALAMPRMRREIHQRESVALLRKIQRERVVLPLRAKGFSHLSKVREAGAGLWPGDDHPAKDARDVSSAHAL